MTTLALYPIDTWSTPFALYSVPMVLSRRTSNESKIEAVESAIETLTADEALSRAGSGDQAAFGQLYDVLTPLIYRIVLRTLRDPAMSEEVTQEVFLQLWQSAPQFNAETGSAKSFAATIARRRAIDAVRSSEASRNRDDRSAREAPQESPAPDARLLRGEEQTAARRALATLNEPQREAIELAYFGGLSYRAVADQLDVPEGTIKTRIRDGMKVLRAELGDLR